MPSQIISFYKKHVYGNELLYPVNSEHAQALYLLTGKKTLTTNTIESLKLLGIECKHVPQM